MGLFKASDVAKINEVAAKSNAVIECKPAVSLKSVNSELNDISEKVVEYFKDSPAILIKSAAELHDYVDKCIEAGYAGIDTETTGLDRLRDTIVGASLYYPGGSECYIPSNHIIPIFDQPYKGQISYEDIGKEFQRLVDNGVKLIFANADYDIAMIYKDLKVDMIDACYYDVITAWRCIKENEKDNSLKGLYAKYVKRGDVDPMKFRDFFSPKLFPYCNPDVAKLYAANDAKITYELFVWQLPYITKTNPKCQKHKLERIADLIWNIEFPMIKACALLHRDGIYLDNDIVRPLSARYHSKSQKAEMELSELVNELIAEKDVANNRKRPFKTGSDFSPNSPVHVKYLLNNLLGCQATSTGKEVLKEINKPVTNKILEVRGYAKLLSTYVDKLPNVVGKDNRVHATFRAIGADTGRMASADPNLQNIPSHATDIRHLFRASPGYVMMSSDYSQQEPKTSAFVSNERRMLDAFTHGRDIYATISSIAFNVPYEECLEFHPVTHEYQPDGKAKRSVGKVLVLGINYGMSAASIADDIFKGDNETPQEEKLVKAQKIYDAVMTGFPDLRNAILNAQLSAKKLGYTETILGRRRHHPNMQLKPFEFIPADGYMNPDIDPLDPSTMQNKDQIPKRIVSQLEKEFNNYKYYGQIVKRTKQLAEEKIKVINNQRKITDASRQCFNSIIQGSAADLTKMAILKLINDPDWNRIGGRFLVPVHDELIVEVPIEYREEGASILSRCMCEAGSFFPFPLTCDVETTFRWYGLSVDDILSFDKPSSLDFDKMTESNIKWLQCMLTEQEYILPNFPDKDGNKPIGIAAHGINGIVSDELLNDLNDCKNRYGIHDDTKFIEFIHRRVIYGNIQQ